MVFSWLKKSRDRILAIGWRLFAYEVFNYLFNYPLYIWAMGALGVVNGWLLMATLSLLSCAYLFWRYDRDGVDWLFANAAKEWEAGATEATGWFSKMLVRISKSKTGLTGIGTFIVASINLDPLIVAVHYRDSHFGGVKSYDWFLLSASVVIANLWWGARIGLFVKILEYIF